MGESHHYRLKGGGGLGDIRIGLMGGTPRKRIVGLPSPLDAHSEAEGAWRWERSPRIGVIAGEGVEGNSNDGGSDALFKRRGF